MKNKELFEDYLKERHADAYTGTDDDMPDDFERWLEELTLDEVIEYGNEFGTKLSDLKK